MNKIEFTKLIKEVVSDSAIENTIENLNDPPGRSPNKNLLAQSEWFKALSKNDRDMVGQIMAEAVHESVFGILCVLDGVRSISNTGESNELKLLHNDVQLNDGSGELLHDIYKRV